VNNKVTHYMEKVAGLLFCIHTPKINVVFNSSAFECLLAEIY